MLVCSETASFESSSTLGTTKVLGVLAYKRQSSLHKIPVKLVFASACAPTAV